MRPLDRPTVERATRDALDGGRVGELDVWQRWLDEHEQPVLPIRLGDAALSYAARGLHVFALMPGAKTPLPKSHGCHDATTDADTLRAWWRAVPDANVGIATGHVVDAIDIDGPAGHVWRATVRDLPRVLGTVSTPRAGGMHLYVPARPGRGNRARIEDAVDYRGRGGYVVAPPSRTDVGDYRWLHALEIFRHDDDNRQHLNGVPRMTLPPATTWLSYRGDVRHIVGEVKGPNMLGEWLTAVEADYDPVREMTHVGFAYGIHYAHTQGDTS